MCNVQKQPQYFLWKKWNEKFGRWVKRDSKGIAVFDKSSDRLKLKYYFDVSDTREGKYKRLVRPVSLWSVAEEQQEPVKRSLGKYIWRDGRRQKRVCDGDSGSVSEYCRG